MRNFVILGLILLSFSCSNVSKDGYITVKVKEVEQVGTYTYLLVKYKGTEYWVAASKLEAKPGDTYRYKGGLEMEDFYSAQLDRTFEKVIFLDELISANASKEKNTRDVTPGSMAKNEKSDVHIEKSEGTITIAELFENPKDFEGKIVQVKGEVTKFNAAIMDRNWVHLQDGTEYKGKFDLTATSNEDFQLGNVIVLEGKILLNQDFGYGYSYEILMENATAVQ